MDNPSPIPLIFLLLAVLFLIAEIISLLVGVSMTRVITGAVHELYQGTVRVRPAISPTASRFAAATSSPNWAARSTR